MKKRVEWIDIAKGILIILVVLGHNHINRMLDFTINSFHMASFFVLSGLTFRTKGDFEAFILKLGKRLLIPYVFFSLLLIAYQYVIHILTGSVFTFTDGLVSIIMPISGRAGTTVYHLWFLPCLFVAEVLVFSILQTYRRSKMRALLLANFIIAVCIIQFKWTGIVSILAIVPMTIVYLLIGYFARNAIMRIQNSKLCFVCIISFLLFAVTVCTNYQLGSEAVDMSSMTLGNPILYFLGGLFGSLFIIALSKTIASNFFLSSIGRESIYYYGLHYEVLGAFRKIMGWGILPVILTILVLYVCVSILFGTVWERNGE